MIIASAFQFVLSHQEWFVAEEGMIALALLAMPHPTTRRTLHRAIATGAILSRDARCPRWAQVAMIVACTVPIPGPVDEMIGIATVAILRFTGKGAIVREAWTRAGLKRIGHVDYRLA